jgi:hypothetical protein
VDVEMRGVDKLEEVGVECCRVPEVELFERGEFICTWNAAGEGTAIKGFNKSAPLV